MCVANYYYCTVATKEYGGGALYFPKTGREHQSVSLIISSHPPRKKDGSGIPFVYHLSLISPAPHWV